MFDTVKTDGRPSLYSNRILKMQPVLHHREKPELVNIPYLVFRRTVQLGENIVVISKILNIEDPFL